MYVLHIANKNYSSWSLRPWVLMQTLGIPFEERLHIFPSNGPSYPEFSKFSPTGFVPVLDDGDIKVWDTLAIAMHLAEARPDVWPADLVARSWARSAAAEMHSGFGALRNMCGMNVGIRARTPEIAPGLAHDLARLDQLWADGIGRFGGPFLAGRTFSAVDAFFCPVAFRVQSYNLPLADQSMAYVQRLLALPAMQSWAKAAIAETSREPNHEAETTLAHAIIEDLRAR
ncbi:MAG TPA: glutathione S-transferase family protein [Devosia sp.]|jgi:glutathione S-transferase|nr:glutathione S-transferase family protein [Devosia sp.]